MAYLDIFVILIFLLLIPISVKHYRKLAVFFLNDHDYFQSRLKSTLIDLNFAFLILFYFLINALLSFFLPATAKISISDDSIIRMIVQEGIFLLIIFFYFSFRKISLWKLWDFFSNENSIKSPFLKTTLISFVLIYPLLVLGYLPNFIYLKLAKVELPMQEIVKYFMEVSSFSENFLFFISVFIVAPIFEEIVFRGIIYPILSQHIGKKVSIIITSLSFGFIHLDFFYFIPLTLLGFALNLIYIRTGTIKSSILMHMLFNLISFVVLFCYKIYMKN